VSATFALRPVFT